jgi:hypothetical protein
MSEKEIGVLPVSWGNQSDEWVYHLARAIHGPSQWIGDLPGEGNPAVGEVILKPPPTSSLHCNLRIQQVPGGIRCVVFDDQGPVDEDDADLWQEAARSAVAQLGKADQDFAWHAIVGPHPCAPEWSRPGPLAELTVIGSMLLTPGGVHLREMTGYLGGRIDTPWPARYTWPVIVSGTVHTYKLDIATHTARKLVYRICALMSVILGASWIMRSGPDVEIPGQPGQGPSAVPQSIGPWDSGGFPDESLPPDFNDYTGDDLLRLPQWTSRAFDLMDQDEAIRRAVYSCYEALKLEVGHPSAAFLIYVATIEGIGARLVDLQRCKECGSSIGAGRRFREALKTVLPDDQIKTLASTAYNLRSKTGHEGQLFGDEHTFGYSSFSLFQFDDADSFDYGLIWPIRKACRELIGALLREAPGGSPLGGEVPAPT